MMLRKSGKITGIVLAGIGAIEVALTIFGVLIGAVEWPEQFSDAAVVGLLLLIYVEVSRPRPFTRR